ncbi:hypothetical protein D9M69_515460 [compost metagenome]
MTPNEVGSAPVEYLHMFGYVAYAYVWARMAFSVSTRRTEDDCLYGAKLAVADFFFSRLLPQT